MYVHEVLVNRLGGLSLPRKSVVRLTGRPDMTLDVYRGRKTTIQQSVHRTHVHTSRHQLNSLDKNILCIWNVIYSNARRARERQQVVVSFL